MIAVESPIEDAAAQAPRPVVAQPFFADYNPAAITYWFALVILGAAAFGISLSAVAALPAPQVGQVLGIAFIAAVVGMFPLRVPNSKNSIAAGDIFIFLLLLLHGAEAAVLAAMMEAAVCCWRTSKRWSSRIVSPAAAAVAMLVCGQGFELVLAALADVDIASATATFAALMLFAAGYFIVSPTLVTTVIYLKRRQRPSCTEWLTSFGWVGMGYLASASVAGVLFLAFGQFGVSTVVVAAPIIAMFLTTLHFYFAQQEASERAAMERTQRERAEAAEREVTQAAQHLRALERSDKRFHSAFTHAAIGMALVTRQGRIVQVNRSLCTMFGRDADALIGHDCRDFIDRSDAFQLEHELQRMGAHDIDGFQIELRCRHADGRMIWASLHCGLFADATDADECLIIQAFDVTARRLAEGRLQHMAYHDGVTNLANRSRLQEALTQAIDAHRNDPANQFSVMYLECDRFKALSDSLGHGAGDRFLSQVARRIKERLGPGDVAARLGGDEFAILTLHQGRGTHHAIALAERLQDALREPLDVAGTEVSASVSIGITFSDIGYRTPEEALRDADLAKQRAKSKGKGRYALFDTSLRDRATDRLLLEAELRRSIAANQLTLAFQPIYELASRRLMGFEALARWTHPELGPISPGSFIPVAEESGLIVQLTQWAIERACQQLRAWSNRFPAATPLFVNVNISGQDLCDPKFATYVRETLEKFELHPTCLTLEITENTLMQQLEMAGSTLLRLRELGVGLSVDDFGTGYSSLSYLSTLPITSLKIDQSFVAKLANGADDTEIVRAVIQLGDALSKRVIAEGIETSTQVDSLVRMGCGYGQGFHLGRPLTAHQVVALIATSTSASLLSSQPMAAADTEVHNSPAEHTHV